MFNLKVLVVFLVIIIKLANFANITENNELTDIERSFQKKQDKEINEVYRVIRRLLQWYHLKLTTNQLVELKLLIIELRRYSKTRPLTEMRSLILQKLKLFNSIIGEHQLTEIRKGIKYRDPNEENELTYKEMTKTMNMFTNIKRWMRANYDARYIMDIMMKIFVMKSAVDHGDTRLGYNTLLQIVDLLTDYPEPYMKNMPSVSNISSSAAMHTKFYSVETTVA